MFKRGGVTGGWVRGVDVEREGHYLRGGAII